MLLFSWIYFFSCFNFCVYFMPLRVYETVRLYMEKEVTLISWWCITSMLSGQKALLHSLPGWFISLQAAQSQPCGKSPPCSDSSGRFRNGPKSLLHPWLCLNDALILTQNPLSQATRKHLICFPAPRTGEGSSLKGNHTARWAVAQEKTGLNAERVWYHANLFTKGSAQPCLGSWMGRQERIPDTSNWGHSG